MFICRDCLRNDPTCVVGYDGHIVLSFGAREVCGKAKTCADCKCHHQKKG